MTIPEPPARSATLHTVGAEKFVSLTTFRRSGAAVATPVWIAEYDGALVVTTPAASGKVKRLRNDPRVELRPCGRGGAVPPGAPTVQAQAVVLGADTAHPAEVDALRRKYGLEYRVIVGVEALTRRLRRQTAQRLILRITPATGAAS